MSEVNYQAVALELTQRLAEVTYEAAQWKTVAKDLAQESADLKSELAARTDETSGQE